MQTPINLFIEINPPNNQAKYSVEVNHKLVSLEIVQEFDDETTGGHIIEYVTWVDLDEQSQNNTIEILVNDNLGFVQLREAFIDQIKMDHVLLLATKVHKEQEQFDGTQLKGQGKIVLTFDSPLWLWWCKNLRSIEVIENVGWKVKDHVYE